MEYVASGAVWPLSRTIIPMIHLNFPPFGSKSGLVQIQWKSSSVVMHRLQFVLKRDLPSFPSKRPLPKVNKTPLSVEAACFLQASL
jgi:hypothetical protein